MSLNGTAITTALYNILDGIASIQRVYRGVPESLASAVNAYVALAGQDVSDKFTGRVLERTSSHFIGLGYRVLGSEATVEDSLAAALDALILAIMADRTLGGAVLNTTLDFTQINRPEYQIVAGQEFRVYPVIVHCKQQSAY